MGNEKDHDDEVYPQNLGTTVSRFYVFKSSAFSLFDGQKVKEKKEMTFHALIQIVTQDRKIKQFRFTIYH